MQLLQSAHENTFKDRKRAILARTTDNVLKRQKSKAQKNLTKTTMQHQSDFEQAKKSLAELKKLIREQVIPPWNPQWNKVNKPYKITFLRDAIADEQQKASTSAPL
jgi:hypothetical protein